MIRIKRAYEAPAKSDGVRILVDRLWPRGVRKESLDIAFWMKELAPSDALRKWFGHDPGKWDEFRKRYLKELKRPEAVSLLREIAETARKGTVTLVYSAKDEQHNQAVVLKDALESL
jgi:uncharacterized protein YeaO (DUF488 family)